MRQLLGKIRIPLLQGNHCRKWYEVQSPPHRLVNAPHTWFVITSNHQLELWCIVKEVLSHQARCNPVTTGESLDLCFSPPAAFFGLTRRNETRSNEPRE